LPSTRLPVTFLTSANAFDVAQSAVILPVGIGGTARTSAVLSAVQAIETSKDEDGDWLAGDNNDSSPCPGQSSGKAILVDHSL